MLTTCVTDRPREEAARVLSDWLLVSKERPVLLLLSGGSAFSFLDLVGIPSSARLTVSMLDERFSIDPAVNNFLGLSQTQFFTRAIEKGVEMLPTIPEDTESLLAFAKRLEAQIISWREMHPEGSVIVTQGIGSDGHTAGILPHLSDPDLFRTLFCDNARLFVGYEAPEGSSPFRERATVTIPFLTGVVERALVFAAGPEKVAVVERLLKGDGEVYEYPMVAIRGMQNAHLVTDIDKE